MDHDAEITNDSEHPYDDESTRVAEDSSVRADREPDVLLDVPTLHVDEIELEVENLRARVNLQAEVLDLLKLNVGADVALDRVKLGIRGVDAQALLKVRLDTVSAILQRVLATIDRNPDILESLTSAAGSAVREVGGGARKAAEEVGKGTGQAAEEVGKGTGQAAEEVGKGTGAAAEEVGKGTGAAAEEVGKGTGQTAGEVAKGAGKATEDLGAVAGDTLEDVRKGPAEAAAGAISATENTSRDAEGIAQPREEAGADGESRGARTDAGRKASYRSTRETNGKAAGQRERTADDTTAPASDTTSRPPSSASLPTHVRRRSVARGRHPKPP